MNIRISVLIQLKKIYGCTYDDFFAGLDPDENTELPPPYDDHKIERERLLRLLTPDAENYLSASMHINYIPGIILSGTFILALHSLVRFGNGCSAWICAATR